MPKSDIVVTAEDGGGARLDVFLADKLPGLSRAQVRRVIDGGGVRVGSYARKAGYKLKAGDRVHAEYEIPEPEGKLVPQHIPLKIVYMDADIIVLDKQANLVVHPGPGHPSGTLVNALIHHFPEIALIGSEERPGIVHRLDQDTSGVMVVARSARAFTSLQDQFRRRVVWKTYLALAWGRMSETEGCLNWPLGRHPKEGARMSVRTRSPKKAETFFQVQRAFKDTTLLEVKPVTGRTHQIRVHLAAAGHPVVGDPVYGRKREPREFPRIFLHAHTLSFLHPATGERLTFASPLPPDLEAVVARELGL
ncbi:MAG: RluA family pseudouridine synthase [Candidatus Aminicenantes bacterium]|nr:RluA family pseudouridine synthase [Candidatus Aminicenantes bacterium]